MYSTCLFCHRALGANEAIEHFPVGRRLAFDAAKGRLWVVCRSCERWNLTPIEERWEAIEECERAFSGTRMRASTDEIGLARLAEGTTLIRIGRPQRPEMAAWRYGDQFGRRRRRHLILASAALAGAVGVVFAGPMLGLAATAGVNLVNLAGAIPTLRTVAAVRVNGQVLRLNQRALNFVALRPDADRGFELGVPYRRTYMEVLMSIGADTSDVKREVTLDGEDALRAARTLLPRINVSGGTPSAVNAALELMERDPTPHALFTRLASEKDRSHRIIFAQGFRPLAGKEPQFRLGGLSPAQRLALEMSLHEDDERRALEGELAELAERWKEAEEIAAISDGLFVPAAIDERVKRLKRDDA